MTSIARSLRTLHVEGVRQLILKRISDRIAASRDSNQDLMGTTTVAKDSSASAIDKMKAEFWL